MTKNKIAYKLIAYFVVALVLFSIVIGSVFFYLFTKHTVEINKNDLKTRATKIAQTLSGYWNGLTGEYCGMSGGYGGYMKFLDDIAMSDVWVVDRQSKLITHGMGHKAMMYSQLPSAAEKVIEEAFKGSTSFGEGFSDVLGTKSITVGVPIKAGNDLVMGVVLLHSPVSGISAAVKDGFQTLAISMVVALLLSGGIAILLSFSFTKPLEKMRSTAKLLAEGDYTVKTGVFQMDEIGQLANTLDLLADRLYDASKESERLEKMRQDFVSNISHELRTPVTVLRGSLEALCDGVVEDADKVDAYHNQMLLESIHLQRLVNDLLDLSRLQNADFVMQMSPLNLCDIVEDVTRGMRRVAEQRQIDILLVNPLVEFKIMGDYSRLRQMLMIVVDNAIKFSPCGATVSIQLRVDEGRCILTVIDKGQGILKEEIPYIFDRFHKVISDKNKNGTGLGLAIAKQIANRHGIVISVSSEPNISTKFSFKF